MDDQQDADAMQTLVYLQASNPHFVLRVAGKLKLCIKSFIHISSLRSLQV